MANTDITTSIEEVDGRGISYQRRALKHTDGTISLDAPPTLTADGALPITGQTADLVATLTVSTTIYPANGLVGGLISFPNAARLAGSLTLQSARLKFKDAGVSGEFRLYLFSGNPVNTTWTDHLAAPALVGTDWTLMCGCLDFVTSYGDLGGQLYPLNGIGKIIVPGPNATLYAALVTKGTPTFSTTSAVMASLQVYQD